MSLDGGRRWFAVVLTVGAPLLLAVVELFHPHAGDLLKLDLPRWLLIHYLQIFLFPLAALAMTTLVRGRVDIAAMLCRVAMFVFASTYIAFDTAAGVITGILAQAANASATPEAWRAPIDVVWTHPIVGGSPLVSAPVFAALGSIALSVGAVAAAVSLKRGGHSWPAIGLLALSGFGITIFKTHAWPGGPLTFGGLALAAAWLETERARRVGTGGPGRP
jgi:hypothetical protein